jgi:dolichol-phosphate mannosyltransferase
MSTTAPRTRPNGTARLDGATFVAAADPARPILRAIGGGTLRRRGARAPIVVTLDGDGQNDPAFLPALIAALEKGAPRRGLVAGQRVGRKATGFKKFQSRVANAVRGAVLKDGTRDTGCGLKAFRRDACSGAALFRRAAPLSAGADAARWFRYRYVDVVDRPRGHGISNYGFWDRLWIGILDLAGVWWLIRRKKRVPEARGGDPCSLICRTRSAATCTTFSSPGSIGG